MDAPPTRWPALDEDGRTPNDCALIAAQAYSKIKPVSVWCQIIGVRLYRDGMLIGAHSVLAYKMQSDGQIFIYDERGTLQIPTSNVNPKDIQLAWQYVLDHGAASNSYNSISDLRLETN